MDKQSDIHNLQSYQYLLLSATIITFLLIVMGNVVRVSNAAYACPDWPTCYAQLSYPGDVGARLQFIHRVLSGLAGVITIIAAILTRIRFHRWRLMSWPIYLATVLMLAQIISGAFIVWQPSLTILSTSHLGLAILALGLEIAATMVVFHHIRFSSQGDRLSLQAPFTRLGLLCLTAILLVLVSGALVVNSRDSQDCLVWSSCNSGLPYNSLGWLQLVHLAGTGAASILMVVQFIHAWRTQRSQIVTLSAATGAFIILMGQILVGVLKVNRGFPADLIGLHASSATALWAVQVVVVISAGLAARTKEDEKAEAGYTLPLRQRLKDFFLLNKPIIVLLLLVTTYAGMVVGGRRLPEAGLAIWTLLGGALAAGGSSAINQYIDRDLDRAMQRTSKRPLPSGRMTPAEGLAYGVGACLLSFFLIAGFVNLLAAILSLAGMVYYVLIYSIWLKKLTIQNIVIGGGAGAIPPLVGWAAACGSLNIPSVFLFAIVFLWTPPHFWALALVRRNDYARVNVPMMPVVRGEKETRTQIFVYTLELVGLTLLMPILKLAGGLFLVSASVLGLWLIYASWKVLRKGGNKTAWKMYRYSSMYLGLIFLALVLDVLI